MRTLFNPKSIALIGASQGQTTVGFNAILSLVKHGYKGEIYPVNPKYKEILGIPCYPSLRELPRTPELAMILVNHIKAVEVLNECGALGIKNAVIVAGGYKEYKKGKDLEEKIKDICKKYSIKLVGPNTLGFANVKENVWPFFWHMKTKPGSVALVSQSGGIGLTVAHLLYEEGIGLSKWIGVGNRTVLEFADYLDYLVTDEDTKTVGIFIEGTDDGRRLYEAACRLAKVKPVAVYKVGESQEVNLVALTHTGSLAGNNAIYSGVFKQAGVVETSSPRELAIALKALDMLSLPEGDKLCVLTFTAGPSIVALDKLISYRWRLPQLKEEIKRKIYRIIGEGTPVDITNPVDMTGPGFLPEVYIPVARVLINEPFDAYLFIWSYNKNIRVPVEELISLRSQNPKPIVMVLLGAKEEVSDEIKRLQEAKIPVFTTPEEGAFALKVLLERKRMLGDEHEIS